MNRPSSEEIAIWAKRVAGSAGGTKWSSGGRATLFELQCPRPVPNVFQAENRLQQHMGLQVRLRDKGVAGEGKLARLQHSPATEHHETALGAADDFRLHQFST